MAKLAFPQLTSGALAQYPLRKQRVIQSYANAFADGSMIVSNINANSQFTWELVYSDLTTADQSAIDNHFVSCKGALLPFIFIDPTDNMISASSNLTIGTWEADPNLLVTAGAIDPLGGTRAFILVNSGQTDQKLSQQIPAPAKFQYCFSIFASAPSPTGISLVQAAASSQSRQFTVGSAWTRLVNSSRLADDQMTFTISIVVPAGQTVTVFGPQLEPQPSPSPYRATALNGGIYANAHFLGDSITFESDAPGLFSAFISIETT